MIILLVEEIGYVTLTNCKNNFPFMFLSYWKDSFTLLLCEITTINLVKRTGIPLFLSLVLHSWCNPSPFFLHMQVLAVLVCWHRSNYPHLGKRYIPSAQNFVIMHFTFDQISIPLGEVFSSQEILFTALVVLIVIFM